MLFSISSEHCVTVLHVAGYSNKKCIYLCVKYVFFFIPLIQSEFVHFQDDVTVVIIFPRKESEDGYHVPDVIQLTCCISASEHV